MSKFDDIYSKLPVWTQNLAITAYGGYWHWLRFGGSYQVRKDGYLEREHYDTYSWHAYQHRVLLQLLSYAIEQVPYYQQTWDKHHKMAAFSGELCDLPLLEKDPLRIDPYNFVAPSTRRQLHWKFYTSGSTGTPIATLWNAGEIRDTLAVRETRSAMWAGVSFRQPRATFSGRMIESDPNSKGPFYRFNAVEKQVYFSPFHLKPDTAHFFVDALRKHQIQWMTGYAVSYSLLAQFILDANLIVPPLKAVITTSEKLTLEMRNVMEKAYHCPVFEEYSTVENSLFASECECGKLHLSPDVGIVEILRPDGSPCEPEEVGEVVTTCLMRFYQPLIRYRLGDLAAWDPEPCSCGRSMPVIKEVVGRIEDVVIGPDGRQMVRFHGIFIHQPHIIEGQIIQEALDRICVKVVPTNDYNDVDKIDVINRVQQRLGRNVVVEVKIVDSIPRTSAGKFKAVISKIHK
jgi:phenylacetate-CoA ligase